METAYRVLIVEDVPADAELNEREITQVLTTCIFNRVETEEDFLRAIDEFKPAVIISDYQMPTFDGLRALKLTLEKTPLTPFILVTGSIDENTAVDCMKAGATDYVVKEHLKQLGPAVIRALEEKKCRLEHLAARESLKESEEKYRNVVERVNDGIAIIQNEIVKFVNTRLAEIWGGEAGEIVGTVFSNYADSEDLPNLIDKYKRRIAGENIPSIYETVLRRKDGGKVYAEINAGVITFQGKPADLIIVRDITDRKRAEAEREKLLRDLGERVKELKCINDISRLAEKTWVSIEEFVLQAVNILPAAWQYPEICCARIMLDSKEFKTANFRETEWSQSADIKVDRKKVGVVTICYLDEKPAADEGPFLKEERGLINTVADFLGHVIQHQQTEAEIRDSEEKFRIIFDNANDGILLADTESKKFHFANEMICRMLGYSREEIINIGVMDIHPEKDIPYVIKQFEKQIQKEIKVVEDLPVKRKDGSVFYADVNSAPVEISGKRYLLGIFRDITERKTVEAALLERIEELERFRNVTIQREFRIKELKDRVKELEEKC